MGEREQKRAQCKRHRLRLSLLKLEARTLQENVRKARERVAYLERRVEEVPRELIEAEAALAAWRGSTTREGAEAKIRAELKRIERRLAKLRAACAGAEG